jgi:hypothetical protein
MGIVLLGKVGRGKRACIDLYTLKSLGSQNLAINGVRNGSYALMTAVALDSYE